MKPHIYTNSAEIIARARELGKGVIGWRGSSPPEYDGLTVVKCEDLKDQVVDIDGMVAIVNHPKFKRGTFEPMTIDTGDIVTANTAYFPISGNRVVVTSSPLIVPIVQGLILETNPDAEPQVYKTRKSTTGQILEWKVSYSDPVVFTAKVTSTTYEYGNLGKFPTWDLVAPE